MTIVYKKTFILCSIVFAFGILFGWAIFPLILNSILKTQIWLKPGSQMREMWSKTPFALNFLVYVFNITNPEEVQNGGKPILQEIGPYHFDEWKDKYDQVDDEEEDSITFNLRDTFIFRLDKSEGLTGEETIIMPNVLFQSISVIVKRERTPMLSLVSKALNLVFPNQTSLISAKFMDLFFRGIFVDCSSDEFSAKALCSSFHAGEAKGVTPFNETHFLFSLMGVKNGTDGGRLAVCRGVKNINKLGKVIRYNDEPEMDVWAEGECNNFKGTDSTIFPPGLDADEGVWAFTPDICRSLGTIYERKSSYAGLPALRYTMDMGDIKANEKLHCFCSGNDVLSCPVKGTMDLNPCISAPIIASMPHFYNGDESLLKNVEGLRPTKEEHAVLLDFEIISGTPLKAAKRLQFNLDTEPVEEIKAMRNVPLLIDSISAKKPIILTTCLNLLLSIYRGMKVNILVRWLCVIGGGIGAIFSAFMYAKKMHSLTITKPEAQIVLATRLEQNKAVANFKEEKDKDGEGRY